MAASEPLELIKTEDGSVTCRDAHTGELYHNRAGAVTEALLNYVQPASPAELLEKKGCLNLLDACFGLGYNTFVLIALLMEKPLVSGLVRVVAIERDREILSLLPTVLNNKAFACLPPLAGNLGGGPIELKLSASLNVELEVIYDDLRRAVPRLTDDFDVVFHDPFSPKRVPELWTVDLFKQYRRLLSSRMGKVLTYSSASAVRGGFLEAGFRVARTPAVGGKSGGTVAYLGEAAGTPAVQDLSEMELAKISARSGVPYRDLSLSVARTDILNRRELEQRNLAAKSI